MRLFGTDALEFFVFKIGSESEAIYKIPLAGSLTNKEIIAFEETNGNYRKQLEWLSNYMGEAVYDLTPVDTGNILKAWHEESKKQGASAGESSASSEL